MQRSSAPAIVSSFGTWQDTKLWQIKEQISQSYWASDEGVYEFQFVSDDMPLTNTVSPHYFQLIRHTPSFLHDAFQTVIQGRLNSDGSIEYGGGRLGLVNGPTINWNDGLKWTRVEQVAQPTTDILDLKTIRAQAYKDSDVLMNSIYATKYLY